MPATPHLRLEPPEVIPAIAMEPVKSNQVASIGYDGATQTLAVTFTRGSGAPYYYPNVAPETYRDFKGAESIGRYFGEHIKPLQFYQPPRAAAA